MLEKTPYNISLAVDTSSLVQSIALMRGAALLAERTLKTKTGHSGALLGAIDGMLQDLGLTLDDLDLLVIGAGPGSFTGLRIGLASLKSLSFARGIPLAAVSSLEAMARGAIASTGLLVATSDARKGEVYAGLYRRFGQSLTLAEVVGDRTCSPSVLVELIAAHRGEDEPVILLGTGPDRYSDLLTTLKAKGVDVIWLDASFGVARASQLLAIARTKVTPTSLPPLDTLEPNYQRASEAEINANKKRR